ncbi:FMN-binding protein, partial [Myxococcota bacterium]|nr:FMN-binding protein [Myxococcota bacterium]
SLFALAGVEVSQKSAKEIRSLFARQFSRQKTTAGTERLVFTAPDGKQTNIYPFSGMGFWGPIHGYIALDGTLSRIRGIVFTRQEETPGLGAEITGQPFRRQFINRLFTRTESSREVLLRIKKAGEAKTPFHIDGITGATETTGRVNFMVKKVLDSAVADRERRPSHAN